MRFKRRYFCCELILRENETKIRHTDLSGTINKSIEKFYGDLGAAEMTPSFSLIYFNQNTNLCILRTARNLEKKFHTLLSFIQKIEEVDVKFKVIHKSGSIKKCKKFMLEYCTEQLIELYRKNDTNEKKIVIDVFESMAEACKQNDFNFN